MNGKTETPTEGFIDILHGAMESQWESNDFARASLLLKGDFILTIRFTNDTWHVSPP